MKPFFLILGFSLYCYSVLKSGNWVYTLLFEYELQNWKAILYVLGPDILLFFGFGSLESICEIEVDILPPFDKMLLWNRFLLFWVYPFIISVLKSGNWCYTVSFNSELQNW